jgi:hypothetical protein
VPPREAEPAPAAPPLVLARPAADAVSGAPVLRSVPPGATLSGLVRELYGEDLGTPRGRTLLDEVRRLNPHLTDVNLIFAGEQLRLPPRASAGRDS